MDKDRLNDFGAYQKANELFELVAGDMTSLARNPLCVRLIGQQVAAADSIGANIDEGYGRGSKKEFAQFLLIARGSAREVRGRYVRMQRWLSPAIVDGPLRSRLRDHRHPYCHSKKAPQVARAHFPLSLSLSP